MTRIYGSQQIEETLRARGESDPLYKDAADLLIELFNQEERLRARVAECEADLDVSHEENRRLAAKVLDLEAALEGDTE